MAELKSYSCPKCGGFLDVDRDRDTFDCPFCGASFNVLDFHREELIDEARKQAYDGRNTCCPRIRTISISSTNMRAPLTVWMP